MAGDEIQEAVYKPQLLSSSFEEAWYSSSYTSHLYADYPDSAPPSLVSTRQ